MFFWGGVKENIVSAEATTELTDEDVNSLYQKVSYQRQSVHDPSIIKDGDEYYVFGSHMGVAKTADLMNWSSTAISDQNKENAYYGLRDEQGNVTKVPFAEAFGKGGAGYLI